ncbi:MAG: archaetidylserine decarboxylase [Woeseiaceae bacterium]|nr:archaetidylserine decarboxylase [Woeseiaceae bacterium]
MFSRVLASLQYLLPRRLLTAFVYRMTRIRVPRIKDAMIRGFVRLYDVKLDEVRGDVPDGFATFNDFFIRELAEDARSVDDDPASIVSPVDGTVSEAGRLNGNSILQAKGIEYSLDDLFAIDLEEAHGYSNGRFATIYLAPYNYHRVHMPIDGRLTEAHYVPGDLFSVNAATASLIPGLFARNERLNLTFETDRGPATLIFVGALNVGSISTPWTGEIRPRKRGVVETLQLGDAPRDLKKGDLLGWFNMGSTVILLLPDGVAEWGEMLLAGETVRMGGKIGVLTDAAP